MKVFLFFFFSSASALLAGQQLDVTIIGTAHYFKNEYQELQDFDQVQDFIVNLQPDIICIEATPTHDTLSLQDRFPKTMERADQLRAILSNQDVDLAHKKSATLASLTATNRALLLEGAEYYANYDFWNAYYRWNTVEKAGDSLGMFQPYHRSLANSEYGLMVFPAARKLGISTFYGIDYRAGEEEFLANNNKVLKQMLFRLKWAPLRSYLRTQRRYKKAEKNGLLMPFINGPGFQNAFSALIDELPERLPKSFEAQQVQDYWIMRNNRMAENLIATARAQNASRILLTVGSAHITHIKRVLEEQGHRVSTYGAFLNPNHN